MPVGAWLDHALFVGPAALRFPYYYFLLSVYACLTVAKRSLLSRFVADIAAPRIHFVAIVWRTSVTADAGGILSATYRSCGAGGKPYHPSYAASKLVRFTPDDG